MMFRQAAIRLALRQQQQQCRLLVTAAQKRALNKQQLEGTKKAADAPPKPQASSSSGGGGGSATSTASATPPPPPPSGGGGNNTMIMGVAAAAALGVGGYVYYSQQQQPQQEKEKVPAVADTVKKSVDEEIGKTVVEATKKVVPKVAEKQVEKKKTEKVEAVKKEETKKEEPVAVEEEPVKEEEPSVGHRVLNINVPPPGAHPQAAIVPPVSHPAGGHKVAMAPPSQEKEEAEEVVVWTAEVAAKELRSDEDEAANETLQKAHRALRANLDESLLQDLDELDAATLKIRIIQLAAEMKERTKWEAVRLKEFLAMKEKETADKLSNEILQKQRLEFESLLARRLLEQEEALTRQANAALQEKENGIQAVIKAATEAQEEEHKLDLKSTQERLERELNAKYEIDYKNQLASEKAEFVKELQTKVASIQNLSEQVKNMESYLEASKTFESGSQFAHRVSAAAMAFCGKAETKNGAAPELATLEVAAGKDGVIAAAISVLPESTKTGIPTLPMLQAKFESVQKKARQAAMVPEGWTGLDGQLLGMMFATLKLAPSPDEPVSDQNDPDYVLARAQRHVTLGELDRAVEQLDKLDGQAAFTVRDWKNAAKDRIAVENAMKVIKMECALLNESHSGAE